MFRFFSNVWENFKEYIILIILLTISLVILSLNQKPAVKKVKSLAFGSFAAFTTVIYDAFNTTALKSENIESFLGRSQQEMGFCSAFAVKGS